MVTKTFSFGKNWQNFLRSLNNQRIENAKSSLTKFLEINNFQGKTFLDIGCGSGLFSYAAFNLGADKIVSFDLDPLSVECCQYLHQKAGCPNNWKIHQGSVLDNDFLVKLGTFDIIYSWGVLHHTGQMWQAIKNSALLIKPDGYYYIAIYNKAEGKHNSEYWLKMKRLYNTASRNKKRFMETVLMANLLLSHLKTAKNIIKPLSFIKEYKTERGMSWKTDIVDWLGGYPYEYATAGEIINFMKHNYPKFELINLKGVVPHGIANNQFLFQNIQ